MRVALFFDGKNHMKDLRRATQDRWLDHGVLADWMVNHVGGTRFAGAWYYTGVPGHESRHTGDGESPERHSLTDLLEELERRPGFFVKRFQRRTATRDCPHCRQIIAYTEEKMVDTSLAVDLVLMATRDVFDIAVVFSGDLDVAPALIALRDLGKQAWIATFGETGLSRALAREAWSHVDLLRHLEQFAHPSLADAVQLVQDPGATPTPAAQAMPSVVSLVAVDSPDVDREVLRELSRAQLHFGAGGGFVGAHYFIHRWKGHAIPDNPESRRMALQRLMQQGRAETYVVEGKTAVRVTPGVSIEDPTELPTGTELEDDEATVEIRLSDTLVRRLRSARIDED